MSPLDRSPAGLRHLRVAVAVAAALCLLSLGHSALAYEGTVGSDAGATGANGTLVATVDGAGPGQIVAYGPGGSVAYRNDSLRIYHDVDPSPEGRSTVLYVGSDFVDQSRCGGRTCMLNVVRRVNLTTGERERVHAWQEVPFGSTQFHDVDRVNESVILVADISYPDRVFMLNTTTDEVVWEWRVGEAFANDTGGDFPSDWTHVNDVEYLRDGRVMVNLRNQDQVVFVDPGEGLQENWTLGADGAHGTLYEQHNPDYIPAEQGGPALLVADSENNRVVEYQRRNGTWERSWVWRDDRLQWPRDADRMPNGNTIIVDSHGSRILAVAPDGSVAWSHPFPDGGYDAEVLGTGDESNGPSAARAGLTSRRPDGARDPAYLLVSLVPPLVLHGLLYALPAWTDATDAVLVLGAGGLTVVWALAELGRVVAARLR